MKVLLITGASGGHIFPAVSFLKALKNARPECQTLLVLPRKSAPVVDPAKNFPARFISVRSMRLRPTKDTVFALFDFLKGTFESFFILVEFRPDTVVGFGSLATFPMVILACMLRIKTIIHEQNVLPGRANKFLAKFVDKVAVSFSKTKEYLDISPEKIVFTGNPLRQELKRVERAKALRFFDFEDAFTILVMGGSQGSHSINMAFLDCLKKLKTRGTLQIIHICGAGDKELLGCAYRDMRLEARVFSFLKEMQYAYSAANIALCRAGATSIAELMRFKLPAIIIPYPFAYQHQRKNAEVLEQIGSAVVTSDEALKDNVLLGLLQGLLYDPAKIEAMRLGYQAISEADAGELLVREVFS